MPHRLITKVPPLQVQHTNDALAAAAVSAGSWAWLSQAGDIAQILGAFAALLAAVCAGWFHVEKALILHRARKMAEAEAVLEAARVLAEAAEKAKRDERGK